MPQKTVLPVRCKRRASGVAGKPGSGHGAVQVEGREYPRGRERNGGFKPFNDARRGIPENIPNGQSWDMPNKSDQPKKHRLALNRLLLLASEDGRQWTLVATVSTPDEIELAKAHVPERMHVIVAEREQVETI
jgi:hypothetical protein